MLLFFIEVYVAIPPVRSIDKTNMFVKGFNIQNKCIC
jgi:hypothetical protein